MFLVTDGAPDDGDDWRSAAAAVRDGETNNRLSFFAVGVPGAELTVLREFSSRPPLTLDKLRFRDMFVWLSRSLRATSRSASHTGGNPAEKVKLVPVDWGSA